MNNTSHKEILDLIPGYALGCLNADEAELVAAHLKTCAACHQELAGYETVTEALAMAVPITSPPANLKARLLEQTEAQGGTAVSPHLSWSQKLAYGINQFLHGLHWRPALALVCVGINCWSFIPLVAIHHSNRHSIPNDVYGCGTGSCRCHFPQQ